MRIMGAVLAGGRSRRFGSDKATALLGSRTLLDHVAQRLAGQVELLVVVGRSWPGLPSVADRPRPGLGPLGGLLGALDHGARNGFDLVLTAPCDCPELPTDLVRLLTPGPAVVADQPVIGFWPTAFAELLARHLDGDQNGSMRGWIDASGARMVASAPLPNCNTPDDLARIRRQADPRSSR